MSGRIEYRSQATACVDDFDAALAFVVRHVEAMHLDAPVVTIQPHITPLGLFVEGPKVHFQVTVSGTVPAPIEVPS